jgi:acetyltransferase-like isoleucine patch superfamily enzyme
MRDYEFIPCSGRITIGDDVYVGGYSQIHAMEHIQIGDGAVLSEFVYISDTSHGFNPRAGLIMKQPLELKGPVTIGMHVFLGYGSTVLPGCNLGDHCIVGARSIVTRSFPAYSMVAGIPAKLIKTYDHASGEWLRVSGA